MAHAETRPARRADAQHNVRKIVDAAVTCLSRDAGASVAEIAQAAGVGRVTVYGHFPSRDALVEAALTRVLADGDAALDGLDLTGDPREALRALIESSWLLVARSSAILEAAEAALPFGRVQELHEGPARRVRDLIVRGQREGHFRTDLPATWLTSALHHVMHGAAADVAKGRLDESDAAHYIAATILASYTRG